MANFNRVIISPESLKGSPQLNIDLIHFLIDNHFRQIDFSLSVYPAFVFLIRDRNSLKMIFALNHQNLVFMIL